MSYRKTLKDEIINAVENLNPRLKERDNVLFTKCPKCGAEDDYLYIDEFKYGRCTSCSTESGFEYYSTVISGRLKEYNDVKEKLKNFIETL